MESAIRRGARIIAFVGVFCAGCEARVETDAPNRENKSFSDSRNYPLDEVEEPLLVFANLLRGMAAVRAEYCREMREPISQFVSNDVAQLMNRAIVAKERNEALSVNDVENEVSKLERELLRKLGASIGKLNSTSTPNDWTVSLSLNDYDDPESSYYMDSVTVEIAPAASAPLSLSSIYHRPAQNHRLAQNASVVEPWYEENSLRTRYLGFSSNVHTRGRDYAARWKRPRVSLCSSDIGSMQAFDIESTIATWASTLEAYGGSTKVCDAKADMSNALAAVVTTPVLQTAMREANAHHWNGDHEIDLKQPEHKELRNGLFQRAAGVANVLRSVLGREPSVHNIHLSWKAEPPRVVENNTYLQTLNIELVVFPFPDTPGLAFSRAWDVDITNEEEPKLNDKGPLLFQRVIAHDPRLGQWEAARLCP